MPKTTRRDFMRLAMGVAAVAPVVPLVAEPLKVVVNKTRSVGKSTDLTLAFFSPDSIGTVAGHEISVAELLESFRRVRAFRVEPRYLVISPAGLDAINRIEAGDYPKLNSSDS